MQRAFDRARQLLEETRGEKRTRQKEGFPSTERTLPRLGSAFSNPITQNISSYLGARNPLAAPIDPSTESVWLFDNTAYRPIHPYPHSPQPWQASLSAAFFKKGTGKDVSKVVADIADKVGLKETGGEEERERGERTIAERLQPFVDVVAPARWVEVKLPNGKVQRLGPGGRSGTSQQIVTFGADHSNGQVAETDAVRPELTPHGPMFTTFAEPEGWMVISGKYMPLLFTISYPYIIPLSKLTPDLQTSMIPSKSPLPPLPSESSVQPSSPPPPLSNLCPPSTLTSNPSSIQPGSTFLPPPTTSTPSFVPSCTPTFLKAPFCLETPVGWT